MNINLDDPKLTAYALDELSGAEKAQMETAVAASPEAQEFVRELRLLSGNLRAEYAAERDTHVVASRNVDSARKKATNHGACLVAGVGGCRCPLRLPRCDCDRDTAARQVSDACKLAAI